MGALAAGRGRGPWGRSGCSVLYAAAPEKNKAIAAATWNTGAQRVAYFSPTTFILLFLTHTFSDMADEEEGGGSEPEI